MHSQTMNLLLILVFAPAINSRASECDPLTQRRIVQTELMDSREILNRIANERFGRALKAANRKPGCDRRELERCLLKYLGNATILGIEFPIGPQEFIINRGKARYVRDGLGRLSIPSLGIKKRHSIFQDLTIRESLPIMVSMGAHVRFSDLAISSDKFTHFFAQGYDYLEVVRERGTVDAALRWGRQSELGSKGIESTGVMSYGDLAANYAGLTFWLTLTNPQHGHVVDRGGKWIQVRCFDWGDYVTPAWDEGINIPCYQTGPIRKKIHARINELVRRRCIPHFPPLDRHRLAELAEHYDPQLLPWLINPVSLRSVVSVSGVPDRAPAGSRPHKPIRLALPLKLPRESKSGNETSRSPRGAAAHLIDQDRCR